MMTKMRMILGSSTPGDGTGWSKSDDGETTSSGDEEDNDQSDSD